MSKQEAAWNFVPIEKKHKRSEFDCGYLELNQYLSRYARQNHAGGINKAFVAIKSATPLKIDGYYTISSSTIAFTSFSESYQKNLPSYPIPAALIGRLAVDLSCQGQGLGTKLLVDALMRIVRVSQELGIYAVRVDAIDETAKQFYLKHEFIPFLDSSLSLFLPLKTIAREFR
jgi:GNAT superfamily N-acetyltransferase